MNGRLEKQIANWNSTIFRPKRIFYSVHTSLPRVAKAAALVNSFRQIQEVDSAIRPGCKVKQACRSRHLRHRALGKISPFHANIVQRNAGHVVVTGQLRLPPRQSSRVARPLSNDDHLAPHTLACDLFDRESLCRHQEICPRLGDSEHNRYRRAAITDLLCRTNIASEADEHPSKEIQLLDRR